MYLPRSDPAWLFFRLLFLSVPACYRVFSACYWVFSSCSRLVLGVFSSCSRCVLDLFSTCYFPYFSRSYVVTDLLLGVLVLFSSCYWVFSSCYWVFQLFQKWNIPVTPLYNGIFQWHPLYNGIFQWNNGIFQWNNWNIQLYRVSDGIFHFWNNWNTRYRLKISVTS